jgi:hypothetical protein
VGLLCIECLEEVEGIADAAEGFHCPSCARDYRLVICPACHSVQQVQATVDQGRLSRIAQGSGVLTICEWCWYENDRAQSARETATAADWKAELEERRYGHPSADDVVLGGFILVGGSGFEVERGAICSVLTLPDAVDVRAERNGIGVATIPYEEMTGLEIADGTRRQHGRFIGGGFGLQGAAEGILIASLLNSMSEKVTINTGLAIGSIRGELLLNHSRIAASDLRRDLSMLFTRFNAARHRALGAPLADDATTQLERLADLRDKGLLTPEEFEAARARAVKRLTGDVT